jgi:hypothetical protein
MRKLGTTSRRERRPTPTGLDLLMHHTVETESVTEGAAMHGTIIGLVLFRRVVATTAPVRPATHLSANEIDAG